MPFLKPTLFALMIASLTGCGTFAPVRPLAELPAAQRQAVEQVAVLNQTQLTGKTFQVLNVVEGISCKNKVWEEAATKTAAITQAKYWAQQKGADAITNVQCGSVQGASLAYNCWQSVSCTAEAIKYN